MAEAIDLARLFQAVSGSLESNKTQLNKADVYNGNHGDNMVQIFDLITQGVSAKKDSSVAAQLKNAARLLSKQKSGSAQVYAKGLSEASKQFKGKAVTQDNAMTLIQTLLGGGQAPARSAPAQSADPLQSLLGGLLGGSGEQDQGFDAGDLLNAGLAYMSAKQRGDSTAEALVQAVVAASPMSQSTHRAQSGSIVASTILEMLGSMAKK